MMDRKIVYAGIALLVILVLFAALRSFFAGFRAGVPPTGAVINFMGVPISLHPVEGRDVPCIGTPEGYARVFFEDESGMDPDMKTSITVAYAREGDHYDEALSWLRSQAETCGYQKRSEQSLAVPGAHGTSLDYYKGDDVDLGADVGVVTGSDGKNYTIIHLTYNEYMPYEDEMSEETTPPPAEAPQEVALPDSLKPVDDEVRPVLTAVFGSAYPTEYVDMSPSFTVSYYVGRYSTSDDVVAISRELEARGWVVISHNDGSFVEIGGQRDNTVLQISFDLNTKKVDVLWVNQG